MPQEHPAVSLAAAIGSPDAYAGEVPVAYAQLRPGASVTEEELLEFAARLIPERAAVPKRIRISSALPMTAVGRIFKPALYALEVEAAIRSEADKIGVTIEAINIEREPRTGLTARVHAVGDARDLRAALDRYAFKAECLPSKNFSDLTGHLGRAAATCLPSRVLTCALRMWPEASVSRLPLLRARLRRVVLIRSQQRGE